jgi:hypothetical protein
MADLNQETSIEDDLFPKQVSGLPEAHVTAAVSLADGDVLPLRIGPIRKTIAGTPLRMLAYNGSIPDRCWRAIGVGGEPCAFGFGTVPAPRVRTAKLRLQNGDHQVGLGRYSHRTARTDSGILP